MLRDEKEYSKTWFQREPRAGALEATTSLLVSFWGRGGGAASDVASLTQYLYDPSFFFSSSPSRSIISPSQIQSLVLFSYYSLFISRLVEDSAVIVRPIRDPTQEGSFSLIISQSCYYRPCYLFNLCFAEHSSFREGNINEESPHLSDPLADCL